MCNVVLALPSECWRWVPGFEGLYQVSTRGRVRSVDRWVVYADGRKYFYRGQIIQPQRDKKGYLRVSLSRDGKPRQFLVHRLVAMAWLDNPEGKPEVNHLDENPSNPDVFNLSYCDHKENMNWGTAIERMAASNSKAVLALDPKTGVVIKEFPSTADAGRNGFNQRNISSCCNGKMLSHRGLVWKYKDDYDRENTWTPVKIGMEAMADSQSMPVQAIDPKTGEVVREFPSIIEAQRNGFSSTPISRCCRGIKRYKTHKGFRWRYKP